VKLSVLLCAMPGMMNDDFTRPACFKVTTVPLKFLPAYPSTLFVYFLKPHFNIILPSSPLSSKMFLSLELSNQNHVHSLLLHPA